MTTIVELGNNLAAMQGRLLEERGDLEYAKRSMQEQHEKTVMVLTERNAALMAFFDERIAAIDAAIGEQATPMMKAAE